MVEIKVAQIRSTCMNVTDCDSFCQALTSVSSDEGTKFPPVAGVMHLALLLRDAASSNMSYDDLKAVIDVKARHL